MKEIQEFINLEAKDLLDKVKELHNAGYRLVQIGCSRVDFLEVNYSFDKDFNFVNLRVIVPLAEAQLPSVSHIYWAAFLYENEISDLYGIKITNMAVDYKGSFYRTTVKYPFNPPKDEPVPEGGVTP